MRGDRSGLPRATVLAHELIRRVLSPGAVAVDATVGNGHDTLMLARCVAPGGVVFGFDIQPEALMATRQRVTEAGLTGDLHLFLEGHERMLERLPSGIMGHVRAVVFNLGYLPGGDKHLTTQAGTTLPALMASLDLLAPGGITVAVCYPGHPAGAGEAAAVEAWARHLDARLFLSIVYRFINQAASSPYVVAVERRRQDRKARGAVS
jgi:SAM-dependent methyltransferase